MSSVKVRVAFACQGGDSQTAFTAGVLKALCGNKNKLRDHFNVVSLSGTSGGGHCVPFSSGRPSKKATSASGSD